MTTVEVVNGPIDMEPAELAERKRLAAVAYYQREIELLSESLGKLDERGADPEKLANQRSMLAAAEAALAAVGG